MPTDSSVFGDGGFGDFLFGSGGSSGPSPGTAAGLIIGSSRLLAIPTGRTNTVTMKRGDSRDIQCDMELDGEAYSLSGHTVWFGAKAQAYKSDVAADIMKISTESGHITVSGNRATAHIQPADTSGLPSRRMTLHYEFQIKTPAGAIRTVDAGVLTVEPDTVRAIS